MELVWTGVNCLHLALVVHTEHNTEVRLHHHRQFDVFEKPMTINHHQQGEHELSVEEYFKQPYERDFLLQK